MICGPKKHLKHVAVPEHGMLDILTGVFAPHSSTSPHKLRERFPQIIFLRNRLKYAPTRDEVEKICIQNFIKIDSKVHTDTTYPADFMDVISIGKTGENFPLIYDIKNCFKVRQIFMGTKGIPHLVTHDAHTICYPEFLIKVNDIIQIDLKTGNITDFIKFNTGNLCMVIGGANLGRVAMITNREGHPDSFDVAHIKDLSMCMLSLQLYLTLCNPIDGSLPGSSVHGLLQAKILE
ncbi:hypothetical protein FD755_008839 [Muntiacus reevesi]|uniref:40S ribosomal protein S4 n=1 Tax=Muntiacus reevesi TaxID=9886 RepID=A0A5J5ML20_MUNRE|nr:hypothetical protein FD755_008839 [Muntiacus reevesi]